MHCYAPVVYPRAVPVWSLHVDHVCAGMCLKAACHMLKELRYHVFRMCVRPLCISAAVLQEHTSHTSV